MFSTPDPTVDVKSPASGYSEAVSFPNLMTTLSRVFYSAVSVVEPVFFTGGAGRLPAGRSDSEQSRCVSDSVRVTGAKATETKTRLTPETDTR